MGQSKVSFAILEVKYAEFNQNQVIQSSLKLKENTKKFIPPFVGSCEELMLVTLQSTSLAVFCWKKAVHETRIQCKLYKWDFKDTR
jgi:hypothetical protein